MTSVAFASATGVTDIERVFDDMEHLGYEHEYTHETFAARGIRIINSVVSCDFWTPFELNAIVRANNTTTTMMRPSVAVPVTIQQAAVTDANAIEGIVVRHVDVLGFVKLMRNSKLLAVGASGLDGVWELFELARVILEASGIAPAPVAVQTPAYTNISFRTLVTVRRLPWRVDIDRCMAENFDGFTLSDEDAEGDENIPTNNEWAHVGVLRVSPGRAIICRSGKVVYVTHGYEGVLVVDDVCTALAEHYANGPALSSLVSEQNDDSIAEQLDRATCGA